MIKDEIFRQYDIRGVVGSQLSREVAFEIGRAVGLYLKTVNTAASKTSVGRDVRLSSDELAQGAMDGLLASGLDVYDIGVCPTPLQYYSLYHLDLDGGIMITGSHNPPEYNGFKISAGKETIHGEAIQRIKEIIRRGVGAGENGKDSVSRSKGRLHRYEIIPVYRDHMLREFSYLAGPEYRRLKIVVDAGNGTAGPVITDIFGKVGCDVIPLYCEPDGRFPNHHPDPTVVEYIQDLITETGSSGADCGVGYDGDADRIGVVDRGGSIVWGDQIMIVLSRDLLKRQPGAKVIGDVKCSQVMFDDIRAHGGTPIMWKTGHSLVKQKMRDEGALLAGEFSGHIFIGERYFGFDDAIYTTLRLIEIMKQSGMDLKGLLADVPRMFYTPEIRMDCPDEKKLAVVERVVQRLAAYIKAGDSPYPIKDMDTIDGVRVIFEKGWGLVRVSNTQPVIVMRFEASDEESLGYYQGFIKNILREAEDRQ